LHEISGRSRVALTGLGADPALSSSLSRHFRSLLRKKQCSRAITDLISFLSAQGRFSRMYLRKRWHLISVPMEDAEWFPEWLSADLERRLGLRDRCRSCGRDKVARTAA